MEEALSSTTMSQSSAGEKQRKEQSIGLPKTLMVLLGAKKGIFELLEGAIASQLRVSAISETQLIRGPKISVTKLCLTQPLLSWGQSPSHFLCPSISLRQPVRLALTTAILLGLSQWYKQSLTQPPSNLMEFSPNSYLPRFC
jgi:hypothetical protein